MNALMKRSVANAFSRSALQYDQHAKVQLAAAEKVIDLLSREAQPINRLLDMGCGTGRLTRLASPFASTIIAADIAYGMLERAREADENNTVEAFVGTDVEALAFGDSRFDTVISSFVLQWCDDLTLAFAELYRVLKAGGGLIMSIPIEPTLFELKQSWLESGSRFRHVNRLPEEKQVLEGLQAAGFQALQWEVSEYIDYQDSVRDILRSIKSIGAHQITAKRSLALTGKHRFQTMVNAYEQFRHNNGQLPVTWRYMTLSARRSMGCAVL